MKSLLRNLRSLRTNRRRSLRRSPCRSL